VPGSKNWSFPLTLTDGDDIVELGKGEVVFHKEISIAAGDDPDVGFEAGGAGHGDEECGELVVAATLCASRCRRCCEPP